MALLTVLFAAGCTGDGSNRPQEREEEVKEGDRTGGRITFGVLGEPATMDPYGRLASDLTIALTRPLYPSLFRMLPDGSTEPYLARAITRTGAGARVELREMRWSDGTPITASDVVRTWRRARLPSGLALATTMRVVNGDLEIGGDRNTDWERALSVRSPILPRGRVSQEAYGGPFVLSDHTPGLQLVLEPNPEWGGEPPAAGRIVVKSIDSVDIMLSLLSEGGLDAAAVPSTVNLGERLKDLDLQHSTVLGWETVRIEIATGRDPTAFSSLPRVVDRERLAEGLIRDEGQVTETLWPDGGSKNEAEDGSGHALPSHVTLAVPRGDEGLFLLQRAMQLQLLDHGIDVDIIETDVQTFYGHWRLASPADLLLMRSIVTPLGRQLDPVGAERGLPLFQVGTHRAWIEGVSGQVPNPTPDGPLWNAQEWSKV